MLNKLIPCSDEDIKHGVKTCAVYVITHITSGMKYVGSTNYMWQRWQQHGSDLLYSVHHCKPLQELYNQDSKIDYVAYTTNESDRLDLEQALMDHYRDKGLLLNSSRKAKGLEKGIKGSPKSKQHREALRKARQTSGAGAPVKTVIIRGKEYPSVRMAARQIHEPYTVVQRRLNDGRYPQYTYKRPS